MYLAGTELFWKAIDAKLRHWVKRRAETYNKDKLALKVIYGAIDNVIGDLAKEGVEMQVEDVVEALWHLLPMTLQRPDGESRRFWECGWKAWGHRSNRGTK